MLNEAFNRIIREYPDAKGERFNEHPLANYIRQELPSLFKESFPQFPELIWDASAGQGRWVDAPWIAAFDPVVTETAQHGYYPVFLFTRSLDAVYLSFNQGMTLLRNEFGTNETKAILGHRARILRARLTPEFLHRFNESSIQLQATGPATRLALYEPGHCFGLKYDREGIPPDAVIQADLSEMLELYRLATIRGGTAEFDIEEPTHDPLQPDLYDLTLDEVRRYRYHRRIERTTRLANAAKEIHGYFCQVCGFRFEDSYGTLGEEYIEAHHLTPLSRLPPNERIHLSARDDFAVLCANCHRMIHRRGAPDSFEEFLTLFSRLRS